MTIMEDDSRLARTLCRLLIVDLDNTLYDWVDYFAPAFRAMVHLLSDRLDIDENCLITEFAALYERFGTTEYPFTVQLLPALSLVSEDQRRVLVKEAHTAFSRSRAKRLFPYPGVKRALHWAHETGITVAVLTSAPYANVMDKLRRLGVLAYIDTVVAWQGYDIEEGDKIAHEIKGDRPRRTYHQQVHRLTRNGLKASGMQLLLKHSHVAPGEAAMVGDSLIGDLEPAIHQGIRPFWATYGLRFSTRNRQTIEAITPGGSTTVRKAYSTGPVPHGVTSLDSMDQIMLYLEGIQATLF